MSNREENVRIFNDTKQRCQNHKRLQEAIKASLSGQYVLAEWEVPEASEREECGDRTKKESTGHRFTEKARVTVSQKRSFAAASVYAREGEKVCVHNFASATNPGGGVERGSSAQEEALCRCSTLYFCISDPEITKQFHLLHKSMLREGRMSATYNDDCIYTPGVVVWKSDTNSPTMMPEKDWYEVDVITCAAPNLRNNPSNAMNPGSGREAVRLKEDELLNLHQKRMTRILEIAKKEKCDVLILGAFGCGAFCNPPRIVAEAMARVIEQYRYDFKAIEFAVYCTPEHSENYEVFKRRLGTL